LTELPSGEGEKPSPVSFLSFFNPPGFRPRKNSDAFFISSARKARVPRDTAPRIFSELFMANNHYAATGVLTLERVTPLIVALFGEFHLKANYPRKGRAAIALTAGSAFPCWENIHGKLSALGIHLGILPQEETPDPKTVLSAWAKHFHVEQDEELQNLIKHHPIRETADLDTLFLLATRFDDGHRLTVIEFEGCWHSSKLRLFGFGGDAYFCSREVKLFDESPHVRGFAGALRSALREENSTHASRLMLIEILRLLDGIQDSAARETVRRQIAESLADFPATRRLPF
jgi:hypothetical protein